MVIHLANAFVGGGGANIASGFFASVVGGDNNIASGHGAAILGGSGNNDGGNPYVGIYGCNVAGLPLAAGNGGFFVNELVIQDVAVATTPGMFAGLQAGQVYTNVAAGAPFLGRPLYIV